MSEISDKIKYLAKSTKMDNREIADKIGCSQRSVRRYAGEWKDRVRKKYTAHDFLGEERKAVLLYDPHLPYHNCSVYELALRYCQKWKPDDVIIGGDYVDFKDVSTWKNDPRRMTFKEEVDLCRQGLVELREFFPVQKIIYLEGNHECLDDVSEILTKDGWKKYSDITTDDFVYTLNKDNKGEWQSVQAVHTYWHDGYLLHHQSNTMDLVCTPEHRIIYRSNDSSVLKEHLAKDMVDSFDAVVASVPMEKTEVRFSTSELQLSAWICTDSHFTSDNKRVILYQRLSNSHKIKNILDSLQINYKYKVREREITEICGKILKTIPEPGVEFTLSRYDVDYLGVFSNKELPYWVNKLSENQWEIFLQVLIDADGTIPTKAVDSLVFYGKKQMCESVQNACVMLGYRATITEYRPNQYRVNIVKTTKARQIWDPKKVKYTGIVWCVTTKNENFFMRRNGKCHFTGNCRLARYLWTKAPELCRFPEMAIEQLLQLEPLGIEYVSNVERMNQGAKPLQLGKLYVLHGHEVNLSSGVVNLARTMYLKTHVNVIFGHHHQSQHFIFKKMDNTHEGAWMVGSLCQLSENYMPMNNWVHGMATLKYNPVTGYFKVRNKLIIDGQIL